MGVAWFPFMLLPRLLFLSTLSAQGKVPFDPQSFLDSAKEQLRGYFLSGPNTRNLARYTWVREDLVNCLDSKKRVLK
ncbi:MAG: hypothetical protein ACE5JX_22935, partial [Acidobacteriota bacterium]